MNTLILVRYGAYENGKLTADGETMMEQAYRHIRDDIGTREVTIVSADVPRARQSANILTELFGVALPKAYPELYAAPEDGIFTNVAAAYACLKEVGANAEVLVAVLSREYIEELPTFLAASMPHMPITDIPRLERGEALRIDLANGELKVLS